MAVLQQPGRQPSLVSGNDCGPKGKCFHNRQSDLFSPPSCTSRRGNENRRLAEMGKGIFVRNKPKIDSARRPILTPLPNFAFKLPTANHSDNRVR
ncbi:hypothetical protein GCM10027038_09190 [Arthrobacter bambusae]